MSLEEKLDEQMKNDTNFVKEKELGGKIESQMLRNQIGG